MFTFKVRIFQLGDVTETGIVEVIGSKVGRFRWQTLNVFETTNIPRKPNKKFKFLNDKCYKQIII